MRSTAASTDAWMASNRAGSWSVVVVCRRTRIAQLVIDLDPELAAVALGIDGNGLVRYRVNVEHDHLTKTSR